MKTLCFYFQLHQPYRLKPYRFFDIGKDHIYEDSLNNRTILRKVADKSYLATNEIIYQLIQEYRDFFKVSFSISGMALEQLETYAPEVIESFQKLAQTGHVEFLGETYAHSLSSLWNEEEFVAQVEQHRQKIQNLFGQNPQVFRNTELIYDDQIGFTVAKLGFKAIMTEGAKHILGWKSPHHLYYNPLNNRLKILLRNYNLSDDIAFRFSDREWSEWPLTTEKYVSWLNELTPQEKVLNVFLGYETFGEHQNESTGIFDFLRALPWAVKKFSDWTFATASEVAQMHQPKGVLSVPNTISWADAEKDLTAWLGNELQNEAFEHLYSLREDILNYGDNVLKKDWLRLQMSDHFYYMCTKFFSDGDVHDYFNPYESPYEAYMNYMNILSDFKLRVKAKVPKTPLQVASNPETTQTIEIKTPANPEEKMGPKLSGSLSGINNPGPSSTE